MLDVSYLSLDNIISNGDLAELRKYVEEYHFDTNTPIDTSSDTKQNHISILTIACMHNQIEIVKYLLEHGANPNIEFGLSPLSNAVGNNNTAIVSLLLAYGADVHKKNKLGRTAIFRGVSSASAEAIILLLDAGANHMEHDKDNVTPMDLAVKRAEKYGRPGILNLITGYLNAKEALSETTAKTHGRRKLHL